MTMITCCIRYRVDRKKLGEFENYARQWIGLITKFGGRHHGFFLPSEGKSDEAICLFSFNSLTEYEIYRLNAASDAEAQQASRYGEESGALIEWDKSFYRPVLL